MSEIKVIEGNVEDNLPDRYKYVGIYTQGDSDNSTLPYDSIEGCISELESVHKHGRSRYIVKFKKPHFIED